MKKRRGKLSKGVLLQQDNTRVHTCKVAMDTVEVWVNGKDPDFFSSGLMALEHHWSKCITLKGNYIEKEEVDLNWK